MRRLPLFASLAACALPLILARCDCTAEPLSEAQPIAQAPEALEFGALAEGTSQAQDIVVENLGFAELDVTAALGPGTSGDFVLENGTITISSRSNGTIPVRFSPLGPGEDSGTVVLTTNDLRNPELTVRVHGGPIEPQLTAPVSVDFSPADASIVQRTVVLTNSGLAVLELESIAVDVAANPQFVIASGGDPDQALLPQGSIVVTMNHPRSTRTDNGRLLVRSNDPTDAAGGGVRAIELVPDPLGPCEDTVDNDGDDLVDYPDDPGCSDFFDESEEDAPDCVDGATQICGTDVGVCESGLRTCVGGVFGDCVGESGPDPGGEICNGLNDDCDSETDEGLTRGCVVNGCAGLESCRGDGSGTFTTCAPLSTANESCNGSDDNCNGFIDDGIVESCTTTVGACPGERQCVQGGTGTFTACAPLNQATCAACGNNQIDPGEQCDDGGRTPLDGCDANCQDEGPLCGDRNVDFGEECDDGNRTPGDGCDANCQDEAPVCGPAGTYTLQGPPIVYQCCYFEALDLFLIDQNITAFVVSATNPVTGFNAITGTPDGTGMDGPRPGQCIDHVGIVAGGCTEQYTVTGNYLDANTMVGTYVMDFVGQDCPCDTLGSSVPVPCTHQEFIFTARRP